MSGIYKTSLKTAVTQKSEIRLPMEPPNWRYRYIHRASGAIKIAISQVHHLTRLLILKTKNMHALLKQCPTYNPLHYELPTSTAEAGAHQLSKLNPDRAPTLLNWRCRTSPCLGVTTRIPPRHHPIYKDNQECVVQDGRPNNTISHYRYQILSNLGWKGLADCGKDGSRRRPALFICPEQVSNT